MTVTFYIVCTVIVVGVSLVTHTISSKSGYDKGYVEGYNFREKVDGSYDTECKVCKHKFNIDKNSVYITKESRGALQDIFEQSSLYDTIDCPYCGCQNILSVRQTVYKDKNEVTTNLKDDIQIIDLNKG